MVPRKAQMFIVTAVFLASMLFAIQQTFVTYSLLDKTEPFRTKEVYVIKNIIDSVNESIRSTPDCMDFQKNLEELLSVLKDDVSSEGYLMSSEFSLECSYWDLTPPNPAPLRLGIKLTETYDTTGIINFYHNQ